LDCDIRRKNSTNGDVLKFMQNNLPSYFPMNRGKVNVNVATMVLI
jgi:hypothetical protein